MFLINLALLYVVQLHIFFEVGTRVSLKVATKGSVRGEKLWKFSFLGCFSEAKTEKYNQKVWNVFDQFGVGKPCSTTYFLQVGARNSLKLATKWFLRCKKSSENWAFQVALLNQERSNATKKFEMFLINLATMYLAELHIF